jgi:hypothetical protein
MGQEQSVATKQDARVAGSAKSQEQQQQQQQPGLQQQQQEQQQTQQQIQQQYRLVHPNRRRGGASMNPVFVAPTHAQQMQQMPAYDPNRDQLFGGGAATDNNSGSSSSGCVPCSAKAKNAGNDGVSAVEWARQYLAARSAGASADGSPTTGGSSSTTGGAAGLTLAQKQTMQKQMADHFNKQAAQVHNYQQEQVRNYQQQQFQQLQQMYQSHALAGGDQNMDPYAQALSGGNGGGCGSFGGNTLKRRSRKSRSRSRSGKSKKSKSKKSSKVRSDRSKSSSFAVKRHSSRSHSMGHVRLSRTTRSSRGSRKRMGGSGSGNGTHLTQLALERGLTKTAGASRSRRSNRGKRLSAHRNKMRHRVARRSWSSRLYGGANKGKSGIGAQEKNF